ncbi:MAG TPA: DUF2203 domain-containing protein [Anaerolineales bacterium]|nr:DUF2203 domain-containing protein [Anaerolineales bacterium]
MASTFSHLFTREEADALLVTLIPLVEEMMRSRARLLELQPALEPVLQKMLGNGGSRATGELLVVFERLRAALRAIEATGVVVKDMQTGLIDFPSKRGQAIVFLCWQHGEPEVAHWHDLDAGFAGRQAI